ncbi:hypothetical protein [uncultured Clostridium sp.]|jgi:hypothetical protein|uniref:hypothetical protein n=1 Tax=uncultured Clostridium sp. TaxID=59620 RepID=UPI00261E4570|nr:hypothetical protein [uncultured Clostridium sp.]
MSIKNYDNAWFVKKYKGKIVIMIKDIEKLIGVNIYLKDLNVKNNIFAARDWNGISGKIKEEFEKINNIECKEDIIFFVYISGFFKILKNVIEEGKVDVLEVENILRVIDNKIKYIV